MLNFGLKCPTVHNGTQCNEIQYIYMMQCGIQYNKIQDNMKYYSALKYSAMSLCSTLS